MDRLKKHSSEMRSAQDELSSYLGMGTTAQDPSKSDGHFAQNVKLQDLMETQKLQKAIIEELRAQNDQLRAEYILMFEYWQKSLHLLLQISEGEAQVTPQMRDALREVLNRQQ